MPAALDGARSGKAGVRLRDLAMLLGEIEAGRISPTAMAGMIEVMERHRLRPPRPVLLLSRTLLTLGTLKTIDAGSDLASEAELLVSGDQHDELGTPEQLLRRELVRVLPALRSLPEHADALATQWRSGRLVMRTERYAGSDRGVVEDWLNRAFVVAAGSAGALSPAPLFVAGDAIAGQGYSRRALGPGLLGADRSDGPLVRTVAQALHEQARPTHSSKC